MNFAQALSFTFDDKDWAKKILIGGLISFAGWYMGLIFITVFFTLGYFVLVIRHIATENLSQLPEWNDVQRILMDGLVAVIYYVVYFVVLGGILTIFIVSVATNDALNSGIQAIYITFSSIGTVLIYHLIVSASLILWVQTNDFGRAVNPSNIIGLLRTEWAGLLGIVIFSFIFFLVLFLAGLAIFSPFLLFWGSVVQAHLLGQLAKKRIARSSQMDEIEAGASVKVGHE